MESTRSKGGVSVVQKGKKPKHAKENDPPMMVLKLRPPEESTQEETEAPKPRNTDRRVQWAEDTIDNEHMDKYKSNSRT